MGMMKTENMNSDEQEVIEGLDRGPYEYALSLRRALTKERSVTAEFRELVERVLTVHWDFEACQCRFCRTARRLGCHPKDCYPTHDPALLDYQAGAMEAAEQKCNTGKTHPAVKK